MVMPAADVLLVATNQGLYRSVDGGLSFGNNAPSFNNGSSVLGGYISDLHLDTASPSTTVLAAVSGSGIFRSTDGGATFPASSNLFTASNGAPTSNFGYISFGQSTSPDNQTIYASIQDTTPKPAPPAVPPAPYPYKGLYESTDGGMSWSRMAAADSAGNGCQCGYDQTIGVDPQDANRVYIGFQELYLSTNGGAGPFNNVSANQIHWDHHALRFSPASHISSGPPTRMWVGTDGGIHESANGGSSWSNPNDGIATNLFRQIDIGRGDNTSNMFTYGGTQDTGTIGHRAGDSGLEWHLGIDGDGGQTAVDPCDPNHVIGNDNGGFIQTTNGGNGWGGGSGFPANSSVGQVSFDPGCGVAYAAVFAATAANTPPTVFTVHQSTDNGGNFSSMHTFSQPVSAIAQARIDSNVMWVGLTDGNLQRTANALAGSASTWTAVSIPGAPGQAVAGIAVDPSNTDQVVVVYPGFCGATCASGNRTKHVFRTVDNGSTWSDISGTDGGGTTGDLPDLPLHSVVIDPGTAPHTIIVSSDAGVMRSANLGATWEVLGLGLPTVDSTALALDSGANPPLLRVGTYGRSTFELTAATGPLLAINGDLGFDATCVGDRATRLIQLFNVGSTDLHVSSFIRVSGSADFSIISGPATPVTIPPGQEVDFTIQFQPTGTGGRTATFQIGSDDPFQPTRLLPASGTGSEPSIATAIADAGDFGDVCRGDFSDLPLTINNNGGCGLNVTSIGSSSPEFQPAGVLNYPLVVAPGDSIQVPLRFRPSSLGPKSASFTIFSNDPSSPATIVHTSGNVPPGDVRVTGSTTFGDVCAGVLAEKPVSVCNVGACDLSVTSVSLNAGCTDFTLVNNPFPATVSHDSCQQVVIRFTPTSVGPKTCTLTIQTDDPDQPVINLPVTGNVPVPMIDVPPDQSFPPTVNQTVGACTTPEPFPVSNTGTCPLTITSFEVTNNQAEYSLSGLPSFPIILEPGHIAGDGDLATVFGPDQIGRERQGSLKVTYLSDPITMATTDVTRAMCGEGVNTGARVLVTAGGIPVPEVESIKIQRINANRNKSQLDTIDQSRNLALVTVIPTAPCTPFQYHKEYGTVSNPIQLLPGSYQVTAVIRLNGHRVKKSVGFDVNTCGFNPTITINF